MHGVLHPLRVVSVDITEQKMKPPKHGTGEQTMRYKIGDKIKIRSVTLAPKIETEEHKRCLLDATIVYIHPKRRFYMLEYSFQKGTVKECFKILG